MPSTPRLPPILPLLPFLFLSVFLAACTSPSTETPPAGVAMDLPPLETRADSLAMDVFHAVGGPDAWSRVRYIRFDFGRAADSTRTVFRSHLWDRFTGDYRVERDVEGGREVVLFNVNTQEGSAFVDGQAVAADTLSEYVSRAYGAYINDTYWLLAPNKLLDPGVTRSYVPDSSDARYDVITTTYDNVGLTPGDQFWFWVDKETRMLDMWGYILQGRTDRPITKWRWEDYQAFVVEGGDTVRVAPTKSNMPGTSAIVTDNVALPRSVAPDAFTRPTPLL